MKLRRPTATALSLLAALFGAGLALAQFGGAPPNVPYENTPYNGKFTFARVRFTPTFWGPGDYEWGLDLKWNHDYPRGESHFSKILRETTTVEVNETGSIVRLDEADLFSHPVTYMMEAGYWTLTDKEAAGLRGYLLKGGFLIIDDTSGRDWMNMVEQLAKVLPQGRLVQIDAGSPIFDSFFHIKDLPRTHPYRRGMPSTYHAIFEDNDPAKRVMVIVNYNNDISEYWEWSDTGFLPIDLSNEAYKLGVNYVVYAMTH